MTTRSPTRDLSGEVYEKMAEPNRVVPGSCADSPFSDFLRFLAGRTGLREDAVERMEADGPSGVYETASASGLAEGIVASCLAEYFGYGFLDCIDPQSVVSEYFPTAYSRANLVLALQDGSGGLAYAISNPFDLELLDTIEMMSDSCGKLLVTQPGSILAVSGGGVSVGPESIAIIGEAAEEDEEDPGDGVPEAGRILEIQNEPLEGDPDSSSIRFLTDRILFTATSEKASDIHIEPKTDHIVVRFRVDGDMFERYSLQLRTGRELLSWLKVLGGLDIAEHRKPQDGALEARISGGRFKMRLATTSTPYGESLIIRILDQESKPLTLEQLGMTPPQAAMMFEITKQNAGAVIVVGPTGSGKSTTLYSLISSIDVTNRSLMTIEDPVEYIIPFANQQQVNERAGVTFEALLRSAVRQDPDIVYLGEIRDSFTAKTCMDLASTGHMTFATLHSSNTATSISRLERLGISREDMSDSILLIESQRLLKKLCPACRKVRPIEPAEADLLARFTRDIPETVAVPVGCRDCRGGYRGRQGVYELLRFNPSIIGIVRKGASAADLRRLFRDGGQYLMSDHGVELVRRHVLSLEDVYRLVLLEEFRLSVEDGSCPGPVQPPVQAAPDGLPAAVAPPDRPAAASRLADDSAAATNQSILVVDDDRVIRSLLEHILKTAGYSVTTTDDGVDAIVTLSSGRFDLILSDVDMPNLDGFKLLEILKSKGIATPVIFLTGKESREDEVRGYELGAEDYLRKPIHTENLLLRIRKALR
jgi:type IV pilus assembly protein PilB